MTNILSEIVANKCLEVASRKTSVSIEQLKRSVSPSSRSFFTALNQEKSSFIFECKRASPSKGLIRKKYDLNEIISVYKDFASAISVLTDYQYFKGSFADLKTVSQSVEQPVLCKDFFIDSYQVFEARYYGADAILLMLSVLNDQQYLELSSVAKSLGLDVLTEVHDSQELQRALLLKAKIIGINNRNLKDLSIDIATTEKLVNQLPVKCNQQTLIISESGINNHQQVRRLAPIVNGFLIGSSIMAQPNIRQQCKKLIYGTIKICGLTSKEAAEAAFDNGAIYGGLIFYKPSPRHVTLEQAKEIIQSVPLDYVGVFVNETVDNIVKIAGQMTLKVIQLHGDESDEMIEKIKLALPNCDIWKSISISPEKNDLSMLLDDNRNIDKYLFDTYSIETPGGSGQTFDWSLITESNKGKIVLAGGLNIDNIKQAKSIDTFALDINSGVETSPGEKSVNKIINIFNEIKV